MQNRTASPRLLAVALCTGLGLAALAAAPAAAQTIGYNVRTGDVWVDNRLDEINRYGHDYRDPFIGELTGQYGAPRSLIVDLLDRRGWAPADVYYACAIASASRVARESGPPTAGWNTSPSSLASPTVASRCWSVCIRNALPETCWVPSAVIAVNSSMRP